MLHQAIQSMDDYLVNQSNKFDLRQVTESCVFERFPTVVRVEQLERLLLNAWSAEYALRITPIVNDEQYLQSSLHWTFPQGYYSVLFSARAFLAAKLWPDTNPDVVGRRIGRLVLKGYYPGSLNFYTAGAGKHYKLNRLAPELDLTSHLEQTRSQMIKKEIDRIQSNPKTAFRDAGTGTISKQLTIDQLRSVSGIVGVTSFFDIITRLRISSTDREVLMLNMDVLPFHQSIINVVSHINAVHELYIIKAVGYEAYRDAVNNMPSYLRESFINERLETAILPALLGVAA